MGYCGRAAQSWALGVVEVYTRLKFACVEVIIKMDSTIV